MFPRSVAIQAAEPRRSVKPADGSNRRVAIVVRSLEGGGAERAVLNLVNNVTGLKCAPVMEWRQGELLADPAAQQVRFASPADRRPTRLQRITRLVGVLHRIRPALVVSALSPGVSTAAAELLHLPVMHWIQNPLRPAETAGPVPWRVQRALLTTAGRRAAFVAGVSPGLASEWRELGVPAWRTGVLPNPIVLAERPRLGERRRTPDRPFRVVSVGRLAPQKRHDLILDAVAELSAWTPIELLIAGAGPLEAALRARAGELGIAARVEFLGFIDDPQLVMAEADVFVLASDYEGFGNVLVEALAAGVRVVATDAPFGPRFILADGRYGQLVTRGSVPELVSAIRRALAQGPMTHTEQQHAFERAKAFGAELVGQRFVEIVDAILEDALQHRSFERW